MLYIIKTKTSIYWVCSGLFSGLFKDIYQFQYQTREIEEEYPAGYKQNDLSVRFLNSSQYSIEC